MSEARRIVLLATDGPSTRMLYHALFAEFPIERVVLEDPVPRLEFLRRRVRKHGYATVAGQVFFVVFVVPFLRLEARRRIEEIKMLYDLHDRPMPADRILRVASANSPGCIQALGELKPSLVVISGTRVLSREVVESIAAPMLNIHAGITPRYRGVHGGYWALFQGDREHCGVTLHRVDAGIDTGPVIAQARIDPAASDNFATYPLLQLGAGILLLRAAIRGGALQSPTDAAGAVSVPSRLWTHPTLCRYLRARFRDGVR